MLFINDFIKKYLNFCTPLPIFCNILSQCDVAYGQPITLHFEKFFSFLLNIKTNKGRRKQNKDKNNHNNTILLIQKSQTISFFHLHYAEIANSNK